MDQVFITKRECLNPRWQEAFEDAVYCKLGSDALLPAVNDKAVYWLDISLIPAEDRAGILQKFAGQVKKWMVMTDEQSDQEALLVMQQGAAGYCHYLATPEQLREISSVVLGGGLWIGAKLMQKLLTAVNSKPAKTESDANDQLLDQLTPREQMVAREVGKGASNKEIAESLDITERTVKAHVSVIFEKLNVRDRVKLALLINRLSK